jgi:hypothetical protein
MTDYLIDRDQWGRPRLYTPEGRKVAHTRPSTVKGYLDPKDGLIAWKASMTALGLARSKSLQARVASIAAGGEGYSGNKGALKEIVEQATTIAQASQGANFGTAVHTFTELADAGQLDWDYVPEALRGPMDAYVEATSRLKVIDSEVFVVIDQLQSAGSLDRLYELDGEVMVGDLKTGAQEDKYPLGCTIQVAIYSRGQRYRDLDFPGSPEFTDGTPNANATAWRKPLHPNLNQSRGIMIHLPLEPVKGKYVCNLLALDLDYGWKLAKLGVEVNAARRKKLGKI